MSRCRGLVALFALVPFVTMALVACDDDGTSPPPVSFDGGVVFDSSSSPTPIEAGGEREADSSRDAAPSHDADAAAIPDADAEAGGPLLAPTLETLKPLPAGGPVGLRLTWTNEETDCDKVLGERKDALHPYTQMIEVAGTVTTADDTTATANNNYTYRLRCMKAGAYSPYSYELSANPTQQ